MLSRYLSQKYKRDYHQNPNVTVSKIFENFVFAFSLWDCLEKRPEGYGSEDFHGNCSPAVVYGLLSRYASENDVILDDMAILVHYEYS